MGSVFYGGKIRMQAVDSNENKGDDFYDFMDKYPYRVPEIYLEGMREDYFPQVPFSWGNDSIISATSNRKESLQSFLPLEDSGYPLYESP